MQITKKWDGKIPMLTFVKGLAVGEVATFPISQRSLNTRLNLYTTSLAMGRRYSSHINREEGVIEIKREA